MINCQNIFTDKEHTLATYLAYPRKANVDILLSTSDYVFLKAKECSLLKVLWESYVYNAYEHLMLFCAKMANMKIL